MERKITLKYFFLLAIISFSQQGFSQAPWCDGAHYYQNSSIGGYSSASYVIALEQVRIRQDQQIVYNHAADGYSGSTNCGQEYRLSNSSNNAITLTAGIKYTIDANSSSAYSYSANFGAFIDLNNDKDFLDAGEYFGAWSDVNNGSFNKSLLRSKDFMIPCNTVTGNTRLRIVCNYNGYQMNASYGCTGCSGPPYYGETLDISIFINKPSSVNADFLVPSDIWIKTVREFINKNPKGYLNHSWDVGNNGTYEQYGTNPDFTSTPFTWTSAGVKCLKLTSSNCAGSDSIVKCFNVSAPTSIPMADFISNGVRISQYEVMQFFDISSYGPWKWSWDVYDSTTYASSGYYPSILSGDVLSDPYQNGNDQYSSTPEFEFDVPGCYTVTLTATNDVGPSAQKTKKCYITVNLPNKYSMGYGTYGPYGDNYVESPTGTISDDGGPFQNYGNNQGMGSRSYLCINPCNAKKIELRISSLKLKDANDHLLIWDGNSAGGPGTVLLGDLTNNSKAPITLTALSGSMYLLFESDGSGIDSGFYAEYSSELGPSTTPTPEFNTPSNSIYNSTPVKFINTTKNYGGVPEWEWTVDGSQVPNNRSKDLNHTFFADGQYQVCLEIKSCSGKQTNCSTVNVTTANQQTTLNFVASKTRPKTHEPIELQVNADNANRFRWNIYPSTYTLLNPPSNPSSYGPGFIQYESTPGDSIPVPKIKFNSPGFYSVTLNAFNSLDKNNTTKTIYKNAYICALEYCRPSSYIISSDLGINRVRIKDGTVALINNESSSGETDYSDYSNKHFTTLNFCKTYSLEIERNTNADPISYKAYIDWNIDGDFNDAGELILSTQSSYSKSLNISFTVPELAQSYIGMSKMRVICNYDNYPITNCGAISAGEIEDYGIYLSRDVEAPVITLIGNDTIIIERNKVYTDQGASAYDKSEGDISYKIIASTDLDMTVPGIYHYNYTITDCSGHTTQKTRTINVVNDLTPPQLFLNPSSPGCIEANRNNDPYIDPGAYAFSINPFINLNSSIVVSGYVDTKTIGNYTLTYTVSDVAGNTTSLQRHVCVEDNSPPTIIAPIDTNIQIGSIWFDPTTTIDSYDEHPVLMKEWKLNHPVNTFAKTIYTVTYRSYDQSMNEAEPVTINYRVDDFIAPVIQLNTHDVVYHDVRKPYTSIPASVSDNYYGADKTILVRIFSDVEEDVIGTYHEIFEATDGSGNVSRKTRTIIVQDNTAPRIWGESIQGCVGENIWPLWGIMTSDNYYNPNQLYPLIDIVYQNVNIWDEGIYMISYRVTDPSGNTSETFNRPVIFKYWPNCKNSTVGISEIDSTRDINIYPNPSSDHLTIDLPIDQTEDFELKIMDMTGKMLQIHNFESNTTSVTISVNDLSEGMYYIQIECKGLVYRKPFVVKR